MSASLHDPVPAVKLNAASRSERTIYSKIVGSFRSIDARLLKCRAIALRKWASWVQCAGVDEFAGFLYEDRESAARNAFFNPNHDIGTVVTVLDTFVEASAIATESTIR